MSIESCAQAVSNLAIQFGDSDDDSGTAMSRPFGVAVMFAVYHKSMTLKEAIKSALTILKQVMEEKLSESNVEVVTMTPGAMFHMFTREQLAEVIKDIP
ncbi:Proteasome subunit alpha type [Operophtera brumata]|uniref:Proteasome subunit alpha type n=1 Tax=Operophtera brumata TaxID=104452 RepID=A0A0L7LPC6_OPEBR|nr:Proteasome subunit alpha type [Operophtera brumata]